MPRLIDADDLLRHYTVNSKGQRMPEKDCDNFPVTVAIAYVKQTIRDALTVEPVQWISVKDRMPAKDQRVLAYSLIMAGTDAEIQINKGFILHSHRTDITHWMPLPAAANSQNTGVQAKWEINPDGYYPYCSICKAEPKNGDMTNYCPNCGCSMKKDQLLKVKFFQKRDGPQLWRTLGGPRIAKIVRKGSSHWRTKCQEQK